MSSAIASINYDEQTRTLAISFTKGGSATYQNVPKSVVEQFRSAGSKGKFFNENIKLNY